MLASADLPPLHPIMVHFTVALVPAALASDVVGAWLGKDSLRAVGFWAIVYAALLTPLTAITGWLWLQSKPPMGHEIMSTHMALGICLAATLVPLAAWRAWLHAHGKLPGRAYFLVAAIVLAEIGAQGYIGGSMTFGHEATKGKQAEAGSPGEAPGHGH